MLVDRSYTLRQLQNIMSLTLLAKWHHADNLLVGETQFQQMNVKLRYMLSHDSIELCFPVRLETVASDNQWPMSNTNTAR